MLAETAVIVPKDRTTQSPAIVVVGLGHRVLGVWTADRQRQGPETCAGCYSCRRRLVCLLSTHNTLLHVLRPSWFPPSRCVAQQEGEKLLRRVPEIDLVMGPQYANRLGDLLEDVMNGNQVISCWFLLRRLHYGSAEQEVVDTVFGMKTSLSSSSSAAVLSAAVASFQSNLR